MAGQMTLHQHIVEHMPEGLLILAADGTISLVNRAASLLLQCQAEEVLNKRAYQVFCGGKETREANGAFLQRIERLVDGIESTQEEWFDYFRPDHTKVSFRLTATIVPPTDEAFPGAIVIYLNCCSRPTDNLAGNIKEVNHTLGETKSRSVAVKTGNISLKNRQLFRLVPLLLILLVGAGGLVYLWQANLFPSQLYFQSGSTVEAEHSEYAPYVVTQRPLYSTVTLTGVVAPLEEVSVAAPFDGKVKERFFAFDQHVDKGTLLLAMDEMALKKEMREHKARYIKARQKYNDILNWADNQEVARARRSFTKAKTRLEQTRKKEEECIQLYDKGIISATELDAAKNDHFNQQIDFHAAQEELKVVLDKGKKEHLDIARYELENTRIALGEVESKLDNVRIVSPVSGIVIRPQRKESSFRGALDKGVAIQEGMQLFTIGDLSGFSIKAKADEIDIGKIEPQQKVMVHGDAFTDLPLTGTVAHISSYASSVNARNPEFDVFVTVDTLTQEQKKRIRLGMTADLEVKVYDNQKAVVVPLEAIVIKGGRKWVLRKEESTGRYLEVAVKTGMTTLDSVEVVEGLQQGDTIYIVDDKYEGEVF